VTEQQGTIDVQTLRAQQAALENATANLMLAQRQLASLSAQASIPHESVWTVRCDEALYRVRLIPRLRAEITPISHPAPESSSERRDAPNSPCG
jgi:hypothetical protein